MDINKASNEELIQEMNRLNGIFEKCKESMKVLYDTMEKASIQYNEIQNILNIRNNGDKREQQK